MKKLLKIADHALLPYREATEDSQAVTANIKKKQTTNKILRLKDI